MAFDRIRVGLVAGTVGAAILGGCYFIFSFCVNDVIKVLLLTFLSASLLPGCLSPKAGALRWMLKGLSNGLQAIF